MVCLRVMSRLGYDICKHWAGKIFHYQCGEIYIHSQPERLKNKKRSKQAVMIRPSANG